MMHSKKINIALVDDNIYMLKSVEEKLSLFDNVKVKSSNEGGSSLLEDLTFTLSI
jgi:hypothetical protein